MAVTDLQSAVSTASKDSFAHSSLRPCNSFPSQQIEKFISKVKYLNLEYHTISTKMFGIRQRHVLMAFQ